MHRNHPSGISFYYDEDNAQIQLVYNKSEHIPLKDFAAEVRGGKDIKEFIYSAIVLLDAPDTSIWNLMEIMIRKIMNTPNSTTTAHRENLNIEEIKQSLFVNDRGIHFILVYNNFDYNNSLFLVQILSKTLQATTATETNWTYDQSWLAIMSTSPSVQRRHVAIARLKNPCNFGRNCQEARFIVFILSPMKEKGTKNFLETGRTFATIFADIELRAKLLKAATQQEFISIIDKHTDGLMEQQQISAANRDAVQDQLEDNNTNTDVKSISVIINTDYKIDLFYFCVPEAVVSQCLGGIFFAVFGGQPLIVVMTTAPLTIYVKVIYTISSWYQLNFHDIYALVGLWNSFFLILYSFFGLSKIMKWSTRSTEEIFALFVSIAFVVDAGKHVHTNFSTNYETTACEKHDEYWRNKRLNKTENVTDYYLKEQCSRDSSLLYLLLTLGTVWTGTFLYKFKQTPYLNSAKRELLADYALPVSVILMTLTGSLLFKQINFQSFSVAREHPFSLARFKSVTFLQIICTAILGFSLSLLIFLDQNIAGAIVNSPSNKLKKGKAFHIDLFVIAILNGLLSLFGLTWMHGALPLSPLHVKALADTEERVESGHIQSVIVKVRETRVTILISHALIGATLLVGEVLKKIPTPVLDGLFLYLALTSLDGNQFFERVSLFFTEQAAYPPNHYIRQVPQRKMHLFTMLQIVQLVILCAIGFSPIIYTKLALPLWLVLMVAFRYKLLPKIIATKYLRALDQRL
ncbi:unnamed protein product [Didymodactylos carnosus]|uniref:Sodium bicarbonate transporter-like protein 11 n=1 Tax=Didymodactylos carnosus TaxID=1234261 RepID=A0A814ATI7_9BILA|nr:unnamed protein product [Didymodactylos carnosus]CAF0917379.1 unnamed protein product [Didymodactylos carnosus]CAF3618790.1 unnamed protein product [Didymodactylos carnosus]CAF3697328.1 unnamed protein product [Didymodactylos carnosus]